MPKLSPYLLIIIFYPSKVNPKKDIYKKIIYEYIIYP